jgi:hypothetical protein
MKNKFININNLRILWAASVLTALFFSTCKIDDRENAAFSEMGVKTDTYIVESDEGSVEIQIFSNHQCDIYLAEEYSWLTLLNNKVSGDGSFTVAFDENLEFRRMAKIYTYAAESNRLDSVILKQKGQQGIIMTSSSPNTKILSAAGERAIPFTTNIPNLDDLDIGIFGETIEQSWISNLSIGQNSIVFSVTQNTSETELRNARIITQYTDGWDSLYIYNLYLIQANAKDEFGVPVTFPQARNWAGDKVSSYEYIEGYIISDAGNMNMGDNPQTTLTGIDYTVNDKTAYIQSADGQYGFMIQTKSAADNVFTRYSRVQLLLKDVDVIKEENPTRYILKNVISTMILSSDAGNYNDLPAKEKFISQLTDDDIYTYVTLKDCEFPVRKGSFTPFNEGYTILYNAHRTNKYPLLMRDIEGNDMYLLTNTKCPYRRDGRMLPYGSGKVSGIIVHETYPRFNYEDADNENAYGQIGRYQIRHVSREDVQFAEDFSNSFSALLTEYRWPLIKNGIAYPTWPNENGEGNNGAISISQTITNPAAVIGQTTDHSYLGPCGSDNTGNTNPFGNGVLLQDGTKQNTNTGTNNDAGTNAGKGNAANAAWAHSGIWWNYAENRGEAYIIEFSTKNIATNLLSMQFAMLGYGGAGSPRFWDVEWSEDGKWYTSDNPVNPAQELKPWKKIASFTLPEVVNWTLTQAHQLAGHRYYNFTLPLEMLGKDKVYIRLIVAKNSCGDGTIGANNYQGAEISNTTNKNMAMGYFAIRYNK